MPKDADATTIPAESPVDLPEGMTGGDSTAVNYPRFIAFEGIDGSGKSTQVKLLAEKLTQAGHQVYTTFEPTDSPIGTMIRDIMRGKMQAGHEAIAGLFVADRLDHILSETNGLIKKIKEGYTVITDRYYFSSYAYHGTHMDMDWVIQANALAAQLLRPDLNIYIDISIETSLERMRQSRDMVELYETRENLELVKAKYEEAFAKQKDQETIIRIDGNRPLEAIAADIWLTITQTTNTNTSNTRSSL